MAGRIAWALALLAGMCLPAQAATVCEGRNLFETMPAEDAAAIEAATEGVPFRRGLVFDARRDDLRIVLVGTYHFDDPRHADTLDLVRPEWQGATALLVESGPEEQARLAAALAADPNLMVDTTGPTLPERLSPEEWASLSSALSDRGIPAIMASRMRPWYLSMMLGLSPCMLRQAAESGGVVRGLDQLMMDEARARGLPVLSLEPWDTIFTLFENLSPEQELDMIRANLPSAMLADDYAVTLTDSYFQGDVWKIWELARHDAHAHSGLDSAVIDSQIALMQDRLMDRRNRAWITPLLEAANEAADQGGHVVAAFGALHLPGETGVLNLLAAEGFAITRLDD